MESSRHELFMIATRQHIVMKRYRDMSKNDIKQIIIDNSDNVEYRQFSKSFQSTLEKMSELIDDIVSDNDSDNQFTTDNILQQKINDEIAIRIILAEYEKHIQTERRMDVIRERLVIIQRRRDEDVGSEEPIINKAVDDYYLKTGKWLIILIPKDDE